MGSFLFDEASCSIESNQTRVKIAIPARQKIHVAQITPNQDKNHLQVDLEIKTKNLEKQKNTNSIQREEGATSHRSFFYYKDNSKFIRLSLSSSGAENMIAHGNVDLSSVFEIYN